MCGIKYHDDERRPRMVDPTSDVGEDVSEDEAPECATCGETIVQQPDHRVLTWIEDDGVQTAHFCDDDCRERWGGDAA